MKKVKVKLVRGLAGKRERHKKTVWSLGLRKPGQEVIKEATPQIMGMIKSVDYLVEWEEVQE